MVPRFCPIVIGLTAFVGATIIQSYAATADEAAWRSRQRQRAVVVIAAPPPFVGGWAPTVQVATLVAAQVAPGTVVIGPTRHWPWRVR